MLDEESNIRIKTVVLNRVRLNTTVLTFRAYTNVKSKL